MALSFGNRHRNLTSNVWPTQRQFIVRKQHSFIENGNSINILNKGRGILTKGLSVGRSYDGIRHKLNTTGNTVLRNAGSYACLQRQNTLEQDFKLKANLNPESNSNLNLNLNSKTKPKDTLIARNPKTKNLNNSSFSTRFSHARQNAHCIYTNNCENIKIKEKNIVAWSSNTSLFKSDDDDFLLNSKKKHFYAAVGDSKFKETRKASITSNPPPQRLHSSSKVEVNKINLNIVLPQAAKISLESETVVSDIEIENSLDSGVNTDNLFSPQSKSTEKFASSQNSLQRLSSSTAGTIITTSPLPSSTTSSSSSTSTPISTYSNSAIYRRAQFRGSHLNVNSTIPTSNNGTISTSTSASASATTISSTQSMVSTVIATPAATTISQQTVFSPSPSLIVQRRPPLVRAMSAPVRPLDENSKGSLAASKRKPRRRRIITRNISCDKTTEQDFITTELINGKKVLTRSRSAVSSEVVTLVSLMSSEGSDSEREDLQISASTKSETSPTRRAPLLRKTGKSVSFQENYPPNFQLASKEYSHMIRRGSIVPLTARMRNNRPPTAPPGSIFLNMTSNTEPILIKDRNINGESNERDERKPMGEKTENNESNKNDSNADDEAPEFIFPDYVRSIKERECWKLYQKMCNKGVNVSYETILRGMLTPTEFRQIQKQRELEEAKEREAEAANEGENVKPPSQSAIDRLSEALLKK